MKTKIRVLFLLPETVLELHVGLTDLQPLSQEVDCKTATECGVRRSKVPVPRLQSVYAPRARLLPHCGLLLDLLPMRGWKKPHSTQKEAPRATEQDISKDEFILSESRVGRGRGKHQGRTGGVPASARSLAILYIPEYTGYSSHQIHVSFLVSTVS